jgi:hypothetical protein
MHALRVYPGALGVLLVSLSVARGGPSDLGSGPGDPSDAICLEGDLCLASFEDYACAPSDYAFQCLAPDEIPPELLEGADYADEMGPPPELEAGADEDGSGWPEIGAGGRGWSGPGSLYSEEGGSDPRLLAALWLLDPDDGGAGERSGESGSGGGIGTWSAWDGPGGAGATPMPEPGSPLLLAIGALVASRALREP